MYTSSFPRFSLIVQFYRGVSSISTLLNSSYFYPDIHQHGITFGGRNILEFSMFNEKYRERNIIVIKH